MSEDSIVKFTSDAAVSSATVVRPSTVPYREFGNLFGNTVQDLQSFLTRPVRFAVGTISGSTNAINNILQTINLDSFFATNPMLAAKHAGHFLGRYSCRVILEVNAERFHQGLVRMSWLPVGGVASVYTARTAHFTTRSTLPHATMNVNCDTALVLDCPWVSPHTHTNIDTTAVGLGTVIIWNQTAIAFGAGSSSIGYTVWLEYYDVDLAVPTAQMAGPKSGNFVVKRLTPGARESMAVQGRPVSSVLSNISLASEYLAKIPLLSSVFGTTSWVTQILANGAYAFGYSKPNYVQAPTRVAPETIPSMLTTDSVDNSSYFALSQENALCHTPWSGTDLDEMAVAYVASRPSIWAVQSWATTDVVDTILNTLAFNPAGYYNDLGTVTQIRYLTPISYITRLAMFWRGSIVFKFNFGKTEFHSGRLAFEYFKLGIAEDEQPRTIVDLREGSEFIITIPYADVKPWCVVDNNSIAGMRIRVINPLVAPSTAEASIQFTIEVYAGSDFELAGPVLPESVLAPSFAAPSMADFAMARPQMADMESPEDIPGSCDLAIERVIGPNQALDMSLNPVKHCMGESYTSWRQLIKRFAPFLNAPSTSGVTFCPTVLHIRSAAATSRTPDYFTMIASCYFGHSGSVRLKTTLTTRVPVTYRSNIILSPVQSNTVSLSAATTGATIAGSFPMINAQSDRNVIEAATPPYMTGLYRVQNSVGIAVPAVGADNLVYGTGIIIPGTLAATDYTNLTIFRAAGEDFNCGIFIGPPPLQLN